MKRRLTLARALLHRPRLVILDEPTAGVDIELRHDLWRYIRRLHREGTTIVLTTHYLEEAESLCEDIALIAARRDRRPRQRRTAQAAVRRERRWRRSTCGPSRRADVTVLGNRGRRMRPDTSRSLLALSGRETLRVSKLWTQTILAPVVASFLFILVFGLSLGSRIREFEGFPYEVFIVPGLIAMAMAQAAFSNNSSSILQARNDRYINDVLAAPMHSWQMNLGLTIGGVVRALVIGAALMVLSLPLTGVPVEQPLALVVAVAPAGRSCSAPSAPSSASTRTASTTTASSTTS